MNRATPLTNFCLSFSQLEFVTEITPSYLGAADVYTTTKIRVLFSGWGPILVYTFSARKPRENELSTKTDVVDLGV